MNTTTKLRKSGIDVMGDIPWGTHVCQFYETKEDLTDVLVPYFKAGLESNEFCIWVTSGPLEMEDAKTSLKKAIGNLDDYIAEGQIDTLDYKGWYVRSGKFDADDALQSWIEKEKIAREKGFEGLRISGNVSWLDRRDWGDFQNYEAKILEVIGRHRMIAVCSYQLDRCSVSDTVEVVNTHGSALFRREGKWVLRDSTEANRIQHQLESSEVRYRRLFETAQDGILILDAPTGKIIDVNPYLQEMLGYAHEEFLGKRLWEIGPFKDIELSQEAFRELQSKGYVRYEHLPLQTKNGQQISVEFVSNAYPIDGASVIQCNIRDITERVHAEEELGAYRDHLEKRVEQRTAELEKANRRLQEDIARRKKAEEGLRESEEKWHSLVENAPVGIVVSSVDGRVLEVNKTLLQMHGYASKEEFLKSSVSDRFRDPKDRQRWVAVVQETGKVEGYEVQSKRKDGSLFWTSVTSVPRTTERGQQQLTTVAQDITARKRAELEYRIIIQTTSDGFWLTDMQGQFLDVNDAYCQLTGYSRDEFRRMGISDVEAIETRETTRAHIAKIRKAGRDRFETRHRCKDGRIVDVEVSAIYVDIGGGEISVFIRDITERKRTEESVLFKSALLEAQAETTLDGILVVDERNKIVFSNKRFQEMWHVPQELIDARDDPPLLAYVVSQVKDPEPFEQRVRYLYQHPKERSFEERELRDGRVYERYSAPLMDANGLRRGRIWYFRDITERKNREEELQKAAKLESISTLAGGIAHDFNNLLMGILGNITLAERKVDKVEKIYDRLVDAEKACLRARDLTQQLLTFSGGGAPIKKPASVAALVKESASFALSGSNVKCDFSLPDDLWAVEVDREQIGRVISNIVINADQAMPLGGMISIRAKNVVIKRNGYLPLPKGSYLQISIKDGGIGISKKHLSKIFEPYFTTKQKGHGLGLATAYSIIKNHGGHIGAESELGVGTTICMYLPATTKPLPEKAETTETERVYIDGRGRILVMDDEEMIRDLLYNLLSEVGYETELTEDGTEAIEKYTEAKKAGKQFDAVVLDLTIPGGMGGKETIEKLLEIDPDVKAIASSGYANDTVMAEFKKYGFTGAVTKPYDVAVLEKTIIDVIRTSESEKAVWKRGKRREAQDYSGTGRARILVMDDVPAVTTALGENLPDLGYEVESARNGDEATSMYRKALESGHSFDVVLVDLTISDGPDGEETIRRLIEMDPKIRAIVTSGCLTKPAMMKPEKFGFRAAIAKPYKIEELGELLHRVVEGKNE